MAPDDSYKNTPVSIGELRADKDKSCTSWTPRDCLVKLLREIDSGERIVSDLVVCWREPRIEINALERGHFYQATQDPLISLGLLEMTKIKMQD